MKNLVKRLAFIAFVVMISFSMSACVFNLGDDSGGSSSSNPFNGTTWRGNGDITSWTLKFTSSKNWELTDTNGAPSYGTYTYSGNTATLTDYTGSDVPVVISGNNLTLTIGSLVFNFTRDSGGGGGSRPGKVTGVTATASAYSIRVSWNAVPGAATYTVQRNPEGNTYYDKVYTGSATSYTDFDVTAGRRYYYRVFATAGYYDGEVSDYVYATPYGGGASVFYPIECGE